MPISRATPLAHIRELQRVSRHWTTRLRLAEEKRAIVKHLIQAGGTRLGKGVFSSVVGMEGCAIKIMRTHENTAYISYARHCQRSHLPMLPKVFHIVQLRRHTLVVLEMLSTHKDLAKPMSKVITSLLNKGRGDTITVSRAIGRRHDHVAHALDNLSKIRARYPRSNWDVHSGNILFRLERGQARMVLSDPITY